MKNIFWYVGALGSIIRIGVRVVPFLALLSIRARPARSRNLPMLIALFVVGLVGIIVSGMLVSPQLVVVEDVFLRVVVLSLLYVLFLTDLRFGIIPDIVVIPGIIFVVLYAWLGSFEIVPLLGAACIGAGIFLIQHVLSRGKWIGGGDVRLGFLVGFVTGWPYIILTLAGAYIVGAITAGIMILAKKKQLHDAMPMGAFLIPVTLIVLWYGETLAAIVFP